MKKTTQRKALIDSNKATTSAGISYGRSHYGFHCKNATFTIINYQCSWHDIPRPNTVPASLDTKKQVSMKK